MATQQPSPQSKPAALDQTAIEYVPFMAKEPVKLTAQIVVRFLSRPTKSGKTCTLEQAVRFMMLCKARGLNPWEGDAFLVGYDTKDGPEFNLVTAHQAFLKRAEVNPEYDGMQSGVTVRTEDGQTLDVEGDFVDEGQTLVGGWARVHFKNRSIPMYRRLKLSSYRKPFGVWNDNAAGMIVKCAEADALRSSFPNHLGGMYLAEEFKPMADVATVDTLPTAKIDLRRLPQAEPQMTVKVESPELVPVDKLFDEAEAGPHSERA